MADIYSTCRNYFHNVTKICLISCHIWNIDVHNLLIVHIYWGQSHSFTYHKYMTLNNRLYSISFSLVPSRLLSIFLLGSRLIWQRGADFSRGVHHSTTSTNYVKNARDREKFSMNPLILNFCGGAEFFLGGAHPSPPSKSTYVSVCCITLYLPNCRQRGTIGRANYITILHKDHKMRHCRWDHLPTNTIITLVIMVNGHSIIKLTNCVQ